MNKIKYVLAKLMKKAQLPAIKNSNIASNSKICSGSNVLNISLDRYSYIGNNCTIIESEIGKFTSIADNCIIGGASHPMDWVSTSPVFHEGKNIFKKNFSEHTFNPYKKTIIGNDVWLGNSVLVKAGVTIQDGAVIGMGSIVTKDIGPYEVWAGNPAKLIKKRFDDKTIKILKESLWWEKTDIEIAKESLNFNDVDKYINLK